MGTEKRQRQKQGRQARIEAAMAEKKKAETRSRLVWGGGAAVLVIAIVLLVTFLHRNDNPTASSASSATPTTSADPSAASTTTPSTAPGTAGTGACPNPDGSSPRTTTFTDAPKMCIDPTKTYTAKVETSKGDMTFTLDPKSAPLAANNFVVLARYHFYDGLDFHRIIPDFVIQGGDPQGNGSGGPGYAFADELPASKDLYQPGTLAMANSGPNTNGSQFFIVLAAGKLDASYSIFGKVTEGFDTTAQAIAKTGTSAGTPTDKTTINKVTITES
jgi:cyclophilin family peptidyl-prolyl cis-trans isomerase